jgi:hypothetical protein
MAVKPRLSERLAAARPWAGVAVPPVVWIGWQQGAVTLIHNACAAAGPPLGPLYGLVAIALCVAAGWTSWRSPRADDSPMRDLLRQGGAGLSALFALASLVLTASMLMVPPCVR